MLLLPRRLLLLHPLHALTVGGGDVLEKGGQCGTSAASSHCWAKWQQGRQTHCSWSDGAQHVRRDNLQQPVASPCMHGSGRAAEHQQG